MSKPVTTKGSGAAPRADRHRYERLSTRQPDALVEAVNVIAKKRNTTVAALLGESTIRTVQDGRDDCHRSCSAGCEDWVSTFSRLLNMDWHRVTEKKIAAVRRGEWIEHLQENRGRGGRV